MYGYYMAETLELYQSRDSEAELARGLSKSLAVSSAPLPEGNVD